MFIKKILLLSFITGVIQFSITQENLVPNGDFENNPVNYNGGSNPTYYYSGGENTGPSKFDKDIDDWYTAKPSRLLLRPDSPDWIKAGIILGDGFCPADNSYYVRVTSKQESIMVGLKNGYKLKKGHTYKFRIKYRHARGWAKNDGIGSFQVVFSSDKKGLRTNTKNKWVALDVYDGYSCSWKYYEAYFTVPMDDNKKYENMKYLILQYNHEINEKWDEKNSGAQASLILHYDDVFLAEGQKCEDIKYIQDWQYVNEHKIEQANVAIHAGAHVSPYNWPANNPVIVKSSSKVIYRAPTVFLEPGFFIEEPGSYFETQVGTCVEDPCPKIPPFSVPPALNCSLPVELGHDLPEIPGVFYLWQPESAFESPWSRTTAFNPTDGSGCIDAKLTIWTICGAAQTIPFPLQYFNGMPTIAISNTVYNSNQIYFNVNISNAVDYTVQLLHPVSGAVLYEKNNETTCNEYGKTININLTQCDLDLCSNFILKVIARNKCYGETAVNETLTAPIIPTPSISITNLVSTDFDFHFDLPVNEHYEYVIIETWNESMNQLICSETYTHCKNPIINSTFHYNVRNCLGSCLNQCRNYKVKITLKNYCNPHEVVHTIDWNKSSTTFSMPSSYPNIITLNGDGVNDVLCFTPVAADYYEIVVVDRWGITMLEQSGCVDSDPVCLWYPPSNIKDGTYFYTITFGNQCGQSDTQHSFVEVRNTLQKSGINPQSEESVPSDGNLTGKKVYVYPNPTDNQAIVLANDFILKIELLDNNGKIIFEEKNSGTYTYNLTLKDMINGLYTLKIQLKSGIYYEKIEKM